MVEGMAEWTKGGLLFLPAPLPRGLNCIGSASLKGASRFHATVMIPAWAPNFKRQREAGQAV
jgi:hypothetical protein